MKILLLTQWYPPEPLRNVGELASSLQSRGHSIEVLTGFPHYPAGQLYAGYRRRLWQREQIDGISVIRVPLTLNHRLSLFRRGLKYLSFALSAAVLGPLLVQRPDVILVYATPLTAALPAMLMRYLWGTRVVLHVQDLWPEAVVGTGAKASSLPIRWLERISHAIYRAATAAIVITPGYHERLAQVGVHPTRIHLVPNWVDTDLYRPLEYDPDLARQLGFEGHFSIVFAGVVGHAQGLANVLAAAALLRDDPAMQFVIVGDGADLGRLRNLAEAEALHNVRFVPRQPEALMPAIFALSQVLLVHLRADSALNATIPHKVFSYMACGRPVLAAAQGDTAQLVLELSAGLACAPQPEALAAAARVMRAMDADALAEMGRHGREAVMQNFSRQRLTARIAEILELDSSPYPPAAPAPGL